MLHRLAAGGLADLSGIITLHGGIVPAAVTLIGRRAVIVIGGLMGGERRHGLPGSAATQGPAAMVML